MTPPLDIVDAHQHFWDLAGNRHPLLAEAAMIPFRYGDYAALKRDYLPADYPAHSAAPRVVAPFPLEAERGPRYPHWQKGRVPALALCTGPPACARLET